MPTCLELAGAAYPAKRNGNALHPLDGVSFAPVLRGESASRPDIFVEHEGNQMVRSGPLKLVRQHTDPLWQLYDMERDRSEMHDLAAENRETFIELARRFDRWAAQAHILPWERAGMYMRFHGYRSYRAQFTGAYDEALAQAPPEEIVRGEGRD
jgi:arylsulfatase